MQKCGVSIERDHTFLFKQLLDMDVKRFLFQGRPSDMTSSLIILAARIAFGLMLLNHGIDKWLAMETASLNFPDPLGIGSMLSFSLAIFAEVFCSVGFIFGALYRLCLIPMIITMAVATFIVHADDPFATKELALIYLVIFSLMFFTGPGRFSIDALVQNIFRK